MAVALHVVLSALAIWSVKITGPPPDTRAIDVQLIQLQSPLPRRERRPPARTSRPASSQVAVAPTLPLAPLVPPAAAAAAPAPSMPSADAAGRVRALLRGSTGCDSAALLKLTEAEQQKCARWRLAQADPNLELPAAIDPVKRSWYEETMRYRKNGHWFPTGPPGPGIMKVPKGVLPPGHALIHLGPLSVGVPPGAFNDDEPPPP